jgi:ferritin-like metal-binding protein YciE
MTENPKELFELLLSNARRSAEQTTRILKELSDLTQDIDTKEALAARVFLSDKIVGTLDQCFKLIGARPIARTAESGGGLQDAFIAECRAGLADIRSPTATRLFVLAKASQLIHFSVGEYVALIACADMTGHCGVTALLETCLADNVAFIELTCRLIGNIVEGNGATPTDRC